MNARFIALTVGIAAAVVSQLYLKHNEKLPTQTVVLGDIPEANPDQASKRHIQAVQTLSQVNNTHIRQTRWIGLSKGQ